MDRERTYDVVVSLEYTLRVTAPNGEEARRIALLAAEFAHQCVRWDELREWQEVRPLGHAIDPAKAAVYPHVPEGDGQ
jgi:hypothetical protein